MRKIGHPQRILFNLYLDCKKRTKKKTEIYNNGDEQLIWFLLKNSSVVEHKGERAYHNVADAVYLACKQLCSGLWCTRRHCENYSSSYAYNCIKTTPKVCKEYREYIEKQNAKKENNSNEDK